MAYEVPHTAQRIMPSLACAIAIACAAVASASDGTFHVVRDVDGVSPITADTDERYLAWYGEKKFAYWDFFSNFYQQTTDPIGAGGLSLLGPFLMAFVPGAELNDLAFDARIFAGEIHGDPLVDRLFLPPNSDDTTSSNREPVMTTHAAFAIPGPGGLIVLLGGFAMARRRRR